MRFISKILTAFLALTLVFPLLPVELSYATEGTAADTEIPNIVDLQKQVDEASATYDNANQRILQIQEEVDVLVERIQEIQDELPEARELSNNAAREYYRLRSTSNVFLEMIFSADSVTDFFSKIEYSDRISQRLVNDISSLSLLSAELEEVRAELEANKEAIKLEQEQAEKALLEAQSARDAAQDAARRAAEASAAATAAEAAAAEAEAHTPAAPLFPGSNPGLPEAPADKQSFVNLWTPRIDAYLAGSPMEGCGYAFANAAYDYNVDPRWSPAIACLESSRGYHCFLPYNAWGWGSVSWPNWETAIYSHVRGLSLGYGYTISEASAKKYCPPNWMHWYSVVSSEMSKI